MKPLFWIIQHAISNPTFMRKCRELLSVAVQNQQVSPINLAHLTDRIAVLKVKPQHYKPYSDLQAVNDRRLQLGLSVLSKQIRRLYAQVKAENHNWLTYIL